MTLKEIYISSLLLLCLTGFSSCNRDDPKPDNPINTEPLEGEYRRECENSVSYSGWDPQYSYIDSVDVSGSNARNSIIILEKKLKWVSGEDFENETIEFQFSKDENEELEGDEITITARFLPGSDSMRYIHSYRPSGALFVVTRCDCVKL